MPCCSVLQALAVVVPQPLPSIPCAATYTAWGAAEEFAPLQTAPGGGPSPRSGPPPPSLPPQPDKMNASAPSDRKNRAPINGLEGTFRRTRYSTLPASATVVHVCLSIIRFGEAFLLRGE